MFFRQFYDQPLAQASYLIGCQLTGEAIVVDPLRDPQPYLDTAAAEGLRITHVTETHIHADFVSGVRELAAASGAQMLLSAEGGAEWQYQSAPADGAILLHDGDRISVGNIVLTVMHTPGHTPEHLAFVVTDTPRAAGPMGVLTGDFVFVGDVGRPDLLERAAGYSDTMEAAAKTLFHSLARFRALPDHLQVWPGHGAGSACGKALGAVPTSTVGYEKLSNWGVAETDEARFVEFVLDGQPEPPRYFADMKRINREGPPILRGSAAPSQLTASDVLQQDAAAWIVDLRPFTEFARAHIPQSLSLPYGRSFSTWAGSIIPHAADILLLIPGADNERVARAAIHDLRMIGLDRVTGWIDSAQALDVWSQDGRAIGQIETINSDALDTQLATTGASLVDVRGESEWREGHIPGAIHMALGDLVTHAHDLPDGVLVMQCQSGARSGVASSLLRRLGRRQVVNLNGGYVAWRRGRALSVDPVNSGPT
jgi:hydroxyacylglutathione hydrolase